MWNTSAELYYSRNFLVLFIPLIWGGHTSANERLIQSILSLHWSRKCENCVGTFAIAMKTGCLQFFSYTFHFYSGQDQGKLGRETTVNWSGEHQKTVVMIINLSQFNVYEFNIIRYNISNQFIHIMLTRS